MTLAAVPSDRPLYWPDIVETLAHHLTDAEVYLVGGVVRDVYLRRPVDDLDLTTPHDGRRIARQIANALGGHYYPLDDERRVGRALVEWEGHKYTIDVAQFRQGSLQADLEDRDFSINALAVSLQTHDTIFDPTDGLTALRQKMVRLCSPTAIDNDPVRAIRAIRASLTLGFHMDSTVKAAVRANAARLPEISRERIRDELFKLLDGPRPHVAVRILDTLGILPILFPETAALHGVTQSPPHIYDVWRHTLGVIEHMDMLLRALGNRRDDDASANFMMGMAVYSMAHIRSELIDHLSQTWPNARSHRSLLILAALAHDIAKPQTRTVGDDGRIHFYQHEVVGANVVVHWAERLALSNDETERLRLIVRHHLRPRALSSQSDKISRRAVYRFWQATGAAGVDVCLHAMADQLGKYGPTLEQGFWLTFMQAVQVLLDGYFQEHEQLVSVKPLLNGNRIMETFGLQPGPVLGQIIAALCEAQASDEVHTEDEAQQWVAAYLDDPDHASFSTNDD
jgi:poly(A) polymerase